MAVDPCLQASPAFFCARMPDGRSYVAQDVEPYHQYWLDERERRLLAAFSTRRGLRVSEALAQCGAAGDGTAPATWRRCLAGMVRAGVLVERDDDGSRYDAGMVEPYLTHRPFPPEITAAIVQRTALGPGRRVLDLAGGPGDLALQLARTGADVSLMDWSGAFLAAARRRAQRLKLPLHTVHESCNRLVHDDGRYDVVTVAQALHWLDDVQVLRGVLRVLRPGGHFIVVHSAFDVPARHPLSHVLGHDSVLGAKARVGFGAEVRALQRRLSLLLQGLQAVGVDRLDPIGGAAAREPLVAVGVQRFRQRRVLGEGFLRGLLTERHLQSAGLQPDAFWADATARCAAAPVGRLVGTHDWALLHFARGARPDARRVAACSDIGCTAPVEHATPRPRRRYSQPR